MLDFSLHCHGTSFESNFWINCAADMLEPQKPCYTFYQPKHNIVKRGSWSSSLLWATIGIRTIRKTAAMLSFDQSHVSGFLTNLKIIIRCDSFEIQQ